MFIIDKPLRIALTITLNIKKNTSRLSVSCKSYCRGVPRIWQGGGQEFFFFRFENLHAAKRHAAHGEAMRFARGVRGHAPPRNFF